jgi:two-component system LytT family response regulator
MKLRAIIVEDEPLAREGIQAFLEEEQDIELVAECADGEQAVETLERLRPDIVFLDVQMPLLSGFEILEALGSNIPPAVIFTTAHDQHAIRAFEVNAVDYLLKPFKHERFRKALQRAREHARSSQPAKLDTHLASLLEHLKSGSTPRLLVRSPDRILFLKANEIDYVEAAGNYVVLHVGKESHTLRETMAMMETRLAGSGFMRVSRSAIINLARVRELQPVAAGEYRVLLQNGVRLDMTCGLRELQQRLAEL